MDGRWESNVPFLLGYISVFNKTLRQDSDKSKLDFKKMIEGYNLNFKPLEKFGPEELEERQQLLFDMVKIISGSENI